MSVIRRSATICTGCWQVVAIDGENNRERIGALCSHLAPMVGVVPSTDTPGAVEALRAADAMADATLAWKSRNEQERLASEYRVARSRVGGQ